MEKFTVKVNRIGYASRDVEVEANSQEEADLKALDIAGGLDFSEHDADYELEFGKKKGAIKKNPVGKEEVIDIFLDENKFPIAYKAKLDELIKAGMTEEDAKNFIAQSPIQMELYYSPGLGLFLVESEAVESASLQDPYTGIEMEEPDEE